MGSSTLGKFMRTVSRRSHLNRVVSVGEEREKGRGTEGSDGLDFELAVAHLLVVENDEGEDLDGCMGWRNRKEYI